jgi:hypothetical protein
MNILDVPEFGEFIQNIFFLSFLVDIGDEDDPSLNR